MSDTPTTGNPGDTILRLGRKGEHEYTLKCTLEACVAITRLPGGLYGPNSVSTRIAACDFDTISTIIRIGLGSGPNGLRHLDQQIFERGLLNVMLDVSRYVGVIANGGNAGADDDDDGAEEGADANPPNAKASETSTET